MLGLKRNLEWSGWRAARWSAVGREYLAAGLADTECDPAVEDCTAALAEAAGSFSSYSFRNVTVTLAAGMAYYHLVQLQAGYSFRFFDHNYLRFGPWKSYDALPGQTARVT